jgi:hypothetical protein
MLIVEKFVKAESVKMEVSQLFLHNFVVQKIVDNFNFF